MSRRIRSQSTRPVWLRRDSVRCQPESAHPEPKHVQRVGVHGHPVLTDVSPDHRVQPRAYCRNGVVHASSEFGFHRGQLRLQSFANRLPYHREASVASLLPADVREAEKVERLRLPFSASAPVVSRIGAEFQQTRSTDPLPDQAVRIPV